MIRFLLVVSSFLIFLTSCLKNEGRSGCPYDPVKSGASDTEVAVLQKYIDSNHIQATKHPNGFFYVIANPGTGSDSVGLCSQVQISYTGRLLDSTDQFAHSDNYYVMLGQLIDGWKLGLPLIRKGGDITLYIPPSLGYRTVPQYGENNKVVIPANSFLVFNIKLIDYTVQN